MLQVIGMIILILIILSWISSGIFSAFVFIKDYSIMIDDNLKMKNLVFIIFIFLGYFGLFLVYKFILKQTFEKK